MGPIKKKHVYKRKRVNSEPTKNRSRNPSIAVSEFLDMNIWRRKKVCCGTIFMGPFGEVVIDPRFLNPCRSCKKPGDESNEPSGPTLTALDATKDVATVVEPKMEAD